MVCSLVVLVWWMCGRACMLLFANVVRVCAVIVSLLCGKQQRRYILCVYAHGVDTYTEGTDGQRGLQGIMLPVRCIAFAWWLVVQYGGCGVAHACCYQIV
jgi:hypothetical protein